MILFSTIVASLYIFLEFLYFLGNHFVISVSPNLENTPCQIILTHSPTEVWAAGIGMGLATGNTFDAAQVSGFRR